MVSKILAIAAFVTLAVTSEATSSITLDSCNVGDQYCCNAVKDAESVDAKHVIAGLANVALDSITGAVGLACLPGSVIGAVSNCHAQPACCTGNHSEGLIVVGCTPIITA